MVKKKSIRQKVRERAKSAGKEENATEAENRDPELTSSVKRKLAKQERFLNKLRETQAALSKTKKQSSRKKKGTLKSLQDISTLAEFLPEVPRHPQAPAHPKKKLRTKSRQKLIVQETKQLAAVLAHPQFQEDPYAAVHKHLMNTVPVLDRKKATIKSKSKHPDKI